MLNKIIGALIALTFLLPAFVELNAYRAGVELSPPVDLVFIVFLAIVGSVVFFSFFLS